MIHYRNTLNADGSFNLSTIMRIAIANARKWEDVSWSYALASELRPVWQIARGLKADFDRRAVVAPPARRAA